MEESEATIPWGPSCTRRMGTLTSNDVIEGRIKMRDSSAIISEPSATSRGFCDVRTSNGAALEESIQGSHLVTADSDNDLSESRSRRSACPSPPINRSRLISSSSSSPVTARLTVDVHGLANAASAIKLEPGLHDPAGDVAMHEDMDLPSVSNLVSDSSYS